MWGTLASGQEKRPVFAYRRSNIGPHVAAGLLAAFIAGAMATSASARMAGAELSVPASKANDTSSTARTGAAPVVHTLLTCSAAIADIVRGRRR